MLTRPTKTSTSSRPSLTLFFLLVGAFLLTLGYHVIQFPIWLSVTIVAAMLLRSVIEIYRLPLPSTTFCGILAIVLLGVIYIQYNTIMGRDAGTAFTAGLLTLKFYELRSPRDISLIIFSCFFVAMSVLLYSQVLELFIYTLIMMWVLTALLMRVHAGDQQQDHLLQMLGRSGVIYLQALPLGLFLLLAFPRYTGTLSFSLDEARLGITDNVAPGSIAKLAKDDSIAMSVHFNPNNAPAASAMYWRGLVLWHYAGGVWTPGDPANAPEIHKHFGTVPETDRVPQEITIRAHYQPWLFALDAPLSTPLNSAENNNWAFRFNGNVLKMTIGRINHLARYTVYSDLTPVEEEPYPNELNACLQLPDDPKKEDINPRVKALAAKLHEGLSDTQEDEYINNVLRFFRDGQFIYSATPGEQGVDWLPVFLFETKTGFCEHFASAFAVLMRLEKIPTRLVAGYWGADYNPYSDNYIVSQSNAHAWDEVWIPTDGKAPALSQRGHWRRVDPTAPVYNTGNIASASGADAQDTLSSQVTHRDEGLYQEFVPPWVRDTMREMQLRRDQVESGWDNLVLSYDPETQLRWAQALGFGNKAPIALLTCCVIAGVLCVFVFRRWLLRKEPLPPTEMLYAEFCQNMAGRGIPRATWEGPLAYTDRVAEAFPDDRLAIQRVGSLVAHARYGPVAADAAALESLKSLLTRLTASQAATVSRDRR
jgi:transglutaminase-like putative cysteine protease